MKEKSIIFLLIILFITGCNVVENDNTNKKINDDNNNNNEIVNETEEFDISKIEFPFSITRTLWLGFFFINS